MSFVNPRDNEITVSLELTWEEYGEITQRHEKALTLQPRSQITTIIGELFDLEWTRSSNHFKLEMRSLDGEFSVAPVTYRRRVLYGGDLCSPPRCVTPFTFNKTLRYAEGGRKWDFPEEILWRRAIGDLEVVRS